MKKLLNIMQIIFYVVISILTVYNLWLNRIQSNLIFKPIVGVADVKPTRILTNIDEEEDTYENVIGAKIDFVVKNVGNLFAKNIKIETTGKIGDTILPHTVKEKNKGVIMIPQNTAVITATIGKDIIRRLVEKGEKLIYKVEFFYTDWDDYKEYNYSSYFEVIVIKKSPLDLGFIMLSEAEF